MKEEVEELRTDGGFTYIVNDQGVKVRNSILGRRLVEDNETFEEYKLRQKFAKNFIDEKSKGSWYWKSVCAPTEKLRAQMAVDSKTTLESQEFLEHKGNNLGTYDKKKIREFLKTVEDGGHK